MKIFSRFSPKRNILGDFQYLEYTENRKQLFPSLMLGTALCAKGSRNVQNVYCGRVK